MDKNENFKNVLNNLKNLSGGMAPDPKSDPALDQNSEGDDQVSNANNEIKPIPGSFIGCISLLGIFSFLNPFFYILKYTVMKKNGDLSTWIAIHSVIFIGIIITFFCFLFLNMISNVSTKESDTNISNVTLFRVFFSIIFLLLFATTIMLSISESCNSNVTLEEEEEMFTGNYEIDKTCKNLKYMNEENGKTYVSMLSIIPKLCLHVVQKNNIKPFFSEKRQIISPSYLSNNNKRKKNSKGKSCHKIGKKKLKESIKESIKESNS